MRNSRSIWPVAAIGAALLALPGLAEAKTVQIGGPVKGDNFSGAGRIGFYFVLDKHGTPTKLASGGYNGIDADCDRGGRTDALGYIKSAKVKKQGKKFKFAWHGKSGPQATASVSGEITKNARKVTGKFSQVYNAGSSSNVFLCRSKDVEFTLKNPKKAKLYSASLFL
jgi:hypothetical protein